MTPENREELRLAFEVAPYNRYKAWTFAYEYPGAFVYYHDTLPLSVFFTPDWSSQNVVDLQVTYEEEPVEVQGAPFYSNTAEDLFAIVRQWLDFAENNVRSSKENPVHWQDWRPDQAPWTAL